MQLSEVVVVDRCSLDMVPMLILTATRQARCRLITRR